MSHVSVIIAGSLKAATAALLALSKDNQIEVTKCVNDAAELFSAMTEPGPDIVLIDFATVNESHYALLSEARRCHPNSRIIFLCTNANQTELVDAFRCGAAGYLETRDCEAYLVNAIRAVQSGEAWVPRRFVTELVERLLQTTS